MKNNKDTSHMHVCVSLGKQNLKQDPERDLEKNHLLNN